jgi:mRNA interferase HigB
MRVHLIKERTIREYVSKNEKSRASFDDWLSKVHFADWAVPQDIKSTFPAADLLGRGSERVIFDIAGNSHRMICKYSFGKSNIRLYVCWIGTHGDYDRICKNNEQYTVFIY